MEIIIHVESRKLDNDYKAAIEEYCKRTGPYCKIRLDLCKDFSKLKPHTSSLVLQVLPGKQSPSSPALAEQITRWNLSGYSRLEFIITKDSRTIPLDGKSFSISSFSLSPDLTAVVLCEQIYRAYTILNHITYHK